MSHIGPISYPQPWDPDQSHSGSNTMLRVGCAGALFIAALLLLAMVAVPFDGDALSDLVRQS